MTARDILMGAAGAASVDKTYVEDVFSTNLIIGSPSNQLITNGIALASKGGMVCIRRTKLAPSYAQVYDTVRGSNFLLETTSTAQSNNTVSDALIFNSDVGFTSGPYNALGTNLLGVAWTFRKAPKFFDVQTKSHTNGTASTVDLSTLGTVGMVIVKRTDFTGNWYVWHKGLTSGYNAYLNTTAAEFNTNAYLSVSGTTLTIASGMPTGTYVVYAYAHDTTTDGLIQCGSYTGNGSTTGPEINLGWEPQYILIKRATATTGNWNIFDNMRSVATGYVDAVLSANTTNAENISTNSLSFTSTGFQLTETGTGVNGSGSTYIYMAIRRGPMKTPTDGTKVFQPVVRQGSGTASVVNTTITPDLVIHKNRGLAGTIVSWLDRLRDDYYLVFDSTGGTSNEAQLTSAFPVQMWDNQTGYDIAGTNSSFNSTSYSYIDWVFKRAPGFFDIVCYTGTGAVQNINHNLGVAPDLMIVKSRSLTTVNWNVYSKAIGNSYWIALNLTNGAIFESPGYWNDTAPTSSVFTLGGSNTQVNGSGSTYVAYLFASCPGVSKVGTYTGTGTTQQINCGFTAGARFVMIKRTDSTGDWYVWDTARGLVAGNDPYLLLNSTAAEVTTTDYIDPYSAGFELSSTAPAALNASGGTYLYLAIA